MDSDASGVLPVALFVLVATAIYVTVGWIVGVRLLGLARRTRGLPELTLGLGECLLAGLVPPFFIAAQLLREPALWVRAFAFAGHLSYTIGCAVMIVFIWRVFRPREGWARALALAMIGVLAAGGAAGMAGTWLAADVASIRDPHSFAFLVMEWVSVLGFVWAAAEAFYHLGRLRRQAAIGLADPELVNRMLLWGLFAVSGVVAAGTPVLTAIALGSSTMEHVPTRLVCGLATIAASVCAQLAFLPPQSYRRWVRSRVTA